MRLVAGRHKGRRLVAPTGEGTRPTADRARQALFSILVSHPEFELEGARVIDCFAGTGALGLEALSRGAAHATFVETHPASLAALSENIAALKEQATTTLLRADATRLPPAPAQCGLAFLDPPYRSGLAGPCLTGLLAQGWLAGEVLAVVEVAAREEFVAPDGFHILDERIYGAARLVFLTIGPKR